MIDGSNSFQNKQTTIEIWSQIIAGRLDTDCLKFYEAIKLTHPSDLGNSEHEIAQELATWMSARQTPLLGVLYELDVGLRYIKRSDIVERLQKSVDDRNFIHSDSEFDLLARLPRLQQLYEDELENLETIDGGKHATLTLCENAEMGLVVMKRYSQKRAEGEPDYRDLIREIVKMNWAARHPHVMRVLGYVIHREYAALMMPYTRLGNLVQFIETYGSLISVKIRAKLLSEVADALSYMHSLQPALIHADIKASNILISMKSSQDAVEALLTNFRTSVWDGIDEGICIGGTLTHRAPELLLEPNLLPTIEGDVYSFGITCWETLAGQQAYKGYNMSNIASFQMAVKQKFMRPQPSLSDLMEGRVDDATVEMVERCWEHDPKNRPTFTVIKRQLTLCFSGMKLGNDMALLCEAVQTQEQACFVESVETTSAGPTEKIKEFSQPSNHENAAVDVERDGAGQTVDIAQSYSGHVRTSLQATTRVFSELLPNKQLDSSGYFVHKAFRRHGGDTRYIKTHLQPYLAARSNDLESEQLHALLQPGCQE